MKWEDGRWWCAFPTRDPTRDDEGDDEEAHDAGTLSEGWFGGAGD